MSNQLVAKLILTYSLVVGSSSEHEILKYREWNMELFLTYLSNNFVANSIYLMISYFKEKFGLHSPFEKRLINSSLFNNSELIQLDDILALIDVFEGKSTFNELHMRPKDYINMYFCLIQKPYLISKQLDSIATLTLKNKRSFYQFI